jgi:hypothetical protein
LRWAASCGAIQAAGHDAHARKTVMMLSDEVTMMKLVTVTVTVPLPLLPDANNGNSNRHQGKLTAPLKSFMLPRAAPRFTREIVC